MTIPFLLDLNFNVPLGNVANATSVNKFGQNTDVDNQEEDIWDRAGSDLWVAPTQARTHQVTSTSTNDTAAGTGARTVEIYGLTDWDTVEVSETITMNGTSNVATVNQYVIIHRMQVLTKGSSGPNVGIITATADTDSTVTAQIAAGVGQTLMAIYGWPSTQSIYVTRYYGSIQKAQTAGYDVKFLVNPEPDAELTGFVTKHVSGGSTNGLSLVTHEFKPYAKYAGPGIAKIRIDAGAVNSIVSGGFDLILVNNEIT